MASAVPLLLILAGLGLGSGAKPPDWVQRLRASNCADARKDVSEMYEDLPYPPRDPEDEVPGEPARLDPTATPAAISHQIYGGSLDFGALGRPFRILVVGGGTGDATVTAAVSFQAAGIPVDVVHVDLSSASIEVARRRVEAHRLGADAKVTFRQGSFLEMAAEDLGGLFDFANAVGVIHHLPWPVDGLSALKRLLRPEAGLFLMVYGELGRTGVYDMQEMWRLSGLPRREFLAGPLQALMRNLPETNRLARNQRMMSRKVKEGDAATLSDLLVHHCDRAYTVASLLELLAEADLRPLAFAEPEKYEVPEASRAALAPLLAELEDPWQRAHFVELLRGDLFVHMLWAGLVPTAEAASSSPSASLLADAKAVICPAWRFAGQRVALPREEKLRCLREAAGGPKRMPTTCTVYINTVEHDGLPCPAVPLLERLDCEVGSSVRALAASLLGLQQELLPEEAGRLSPAEAEEMVRKLYQVLSRKGQQQVFLLQSALHFARPTWRERAVQRVVVKRDWAAATAAEEEAAAESTLEL